MIHINRKNKDYKISNKEKDLRIRSARLACCCYPTILQGLGLDERPRSPGAEDHPTTWNTGHTQIKIAEESAVKRISSRAGQNKM